jgi:CheY-like chemotaxis protein
VSQLQTAAVNSTDLPAAVVALPLVLVADPDGSSRERRADQLQARGFRVALARTSFEAIVKAACLLPDLILMDASLGHDPERETADLISMCPATAHIPIVKLSAGRRLPARVLARRVSG